MVARTLMAMALLAVLAPAQLSDEDRAKLEEFVEYMKSDEVSTRLDQVEQLGFVDGPEATELLLETGLTDKSVQVRKKAVWALARKESGAALELMRAAYRHKNALVRAGAISAMGRSEDPRELEEIAACLSKERKAPVQVAIMRALEANNSELGAPQAFKLVKSKDPSVVHAAIDMLGATKSPRWAKALHPLLHSKDWSVQSAALSALARTRARESIPLIIDLMEKIKGRLRVECREALMEITGNQYGLDPAQWRKWWDRYSETWKVPEVVKLPDAAREGYSTKDTTYYHGIKTKSKHLLFIVDVSSSMMQKIRYMPRDGDKHVTRVRWQLAKKELFRTLDGIAGTNTFFNIVTFEAVVNAYKPKAVKATKGNISAAKRWMDKNGPEALARKAEAGNAGYTKDGYKRGETNTFAALKWAVGIKGKGLSITGKLKPPANTVFFLSDGDPSCGEVIITDQIRDLIAEYNKTARVVIHTIAFDCRGLGRQLLADVARLSGGKFVDVAGMR